MSGDKNENKRKSKGLTWAEASKIVLERAGCPMTHKEILQVIQDEKLRDVSRGTSSLACLNAMLHHHSRGSDAVFYKVEGRMSCYGIKKSKSESTIPVMNNCKDNDPSSPSVSTVSSQQPVFSYSEPPLPLDSPSIISASTNNPEPSPIPQESPDPAVVVEVPDIQREETLSCGSPTEKDNTAFLPKSAATFLSPPPKRPRPLSKSSKNNRKRIPDPRVRVSQPPPKKSKPNSTRPRPVAKNVLKNLKVGTVGEMSEGQSSGENKMKKLSSSISSASSVDGSVNGDGHTTPQIAAARNMVKFSGLHTKKQRRYKKMSVADQIKRTKEGRVDLQSPESILASVPLRSLLNNRTFHLLPPAYQYQLLMLLPKVDRVVGPDGGLRPSSTAFTNEFFTSTCHLWRDRLKDGEFTPEMQQKLRTEEEKLTKIDPWKAKFFEPVWGQKSLSRLDNDMLPLFPGLTPESDNPLNVLQCWQPPSLVDRSLTNTGLMQADNVTVTSKTEQLNNAFVPQLTVPVKKLEASVLTKASKTKHKQMCVGPLKRSEAAKSLTSKAKAKISAVSIILSASEASNALSAIRNFEPPDMLPASKLLTRKKIIKIPIAEPSSTTKAKPKNTSSTPIVKRTEDINPDFTLNSLSVNPPTQVNSNASINFPKEPIFKSSNDTVSRPLSSLLPSNANTITSSLNSLMPKNCRCRMKAMKVCRMCGAFCHDDCITNTQLCATCVN
ncbi:putative Polycomb group protein ASXL2 isoform X2 [Actinia tenebrosa]|uniref:Polycomb group protein ASXL2 isoform X2 n=1 Tax=Actinia tenebrosa TaxID=6105 RepID=A0A6P8H9T1_ACTTE|nr:putative Polycomb group protein ASXL2 isoform X2 [Actinia tenebrosa]